MDKKLIELMHREIDGDLTPAEKSGLEQQLGKRPEARQIYEQLKSVDAAMTSIPQVEPPSEMKGEIMRQIRPWRKPAPGWGDRIRTSVRALREQFHVRPAIPFAVGVATGLALLVIYVASNEPVSIQGDSQFAATLVAPQTEGNPDIERHFTLPQATGTITVTHSEGIAWMRFQTASTAGSEVTVTYDPKMLTVRGLGQQHIGEASLRQSEGLVQVRQSGDADFRLAFVGQAHPVATVAISVTSGGNEYKDSVELKPDYLTSGGSGKEAQ